MKPIKPVYLNTAIIIIDIKLKVY